MTSSTSDRATGGQHDMNSIEALEGQFLRAMSTSAALVTGTNEQGQGSDLLACPRQASTVELYLGGVR